MSDNNVTPIKAKLTFEEVKAAAEAEVKKENLEKYKAEYKALLKKLDAAQLIVRNVERELESLQEKFGE